MSDMPAGVSDQHPPTAICNAAFNLISSFESQTSAAGSSCSGRRASSLVAALVPALCLQQAKLNKVCQDTGMQHKGLDALVKQGSLNAQRICLLSWESLALLAKLRLHSTALLPLSTSLKARDQVECTGAYHQVLPC